MHRGTAYGHAGRLLGSTGQRSVASGSFLDIEKFVRARLPSPTPHVFLFPTRLFWKLSVYPFPGFWLVAHNGPLLPLLVSALPYISLTSDRSPFLCGSVTRTTRVRSLFAKRTVNETRADDDTQNRIRNTRSWFHLEPPGKDENKVCGCCVKQAG